MVKGFLAGGDHRRRGVSVSNDTAESKRISAVFSRSKQAERFEIFASAIGKEIGKVPFDDPLSERDHFAHESRALKRLEEPA